MSVDGEETRRIRYREVIQSFTLLDDVFMTAVFQDSLPCVDLVLQIILNQPNLRATRVVTQDTLKNLRGHDLWLDIHAFADGQDLTSRFSVQKRALHHAGHAITAASWMQMHCPRGRTMRNCRSRM